MQLTIQQILEERKRLRRATILNYGPPGSGKTRCLYTLYKMGLKPGWVFDLDFGIDPLISLCQADPNFKTEDLTVFRYAPLSGDRVGMTEKRPKNQGKEIFTAFLDDFNKLQDMVDTSPTGQLQWRNNLKITPPAWICIDSQTSLNEIILDFVLTMRNHDLWAPGTDARKDFGYQMEKIQEIIRASQVLPCLAIFNFHEKKIFRSVQQEKGDPVDVLESIEPSVTGQLSNTIGKDFSIVLHSRSDGLKYKWLTRPSGFYKTAKTRFREGLQMEVEQDFANVL